MSPLERLLRLARRVRRRYGFVDHTVRAALRYDQVEGGRLAAAVTYYAFFAAFGLAVLGLAVLGVLVRGNHLVLDAVSRYLAENLPTLQVDAVSRASGLAGVVGLAALLYAGLRWVNVLRSSVRAVWELDEHPGNVVVRRIVDLVVLVGLGVLLGITIGIALAVGQGVQWLVTGAWEDSGSGQWLVSAVAFVLGLAVNGVLGAAVLASLPRLRIPFRRLLPAALVIAGGLEALKTVGRLFIERTTHNPAYQVVGGAVGLLLFLNLFNQLLLYASALVATSRHGTVYDLASRPPTELTNRR